MDFINSNTITRKIAEIARQHGVEAYLVGGFVRDKRLGIGKSDIDISVIGSAVTFASVIARCFNKELDAVYEKFGTSLLTLTDTDNEPVKVEFASARKESYRRDSRKPEVEFSGLIDDLSRRDFTVNALAVSLNDDSNAVIDHFDGLTDLRNKVLRTPLEPQKTFDDDPLRIMRACRFAAQLDFSIAPETFEAMREMRRRLLITDPAHSVVSQERITEEFMKILSSQKPSTGLKLLFKSRIMELIFPEISAMEGVDQRRDFHHKDVFYHTLQVVDNAASRSGNLWLRFAALMHDIAKPATKKFSEGTGWTFHGHEELGARWQRKIFRKMKLPLDKLPYVEKLVRLHLRPIALAEENVTDSAIRRLIYEAGDDIEDLLTLCRSDITSKDPDKVSKFLENFNRVEKRIAEVEERDRIRNFQSPVRGEEIMAICKLQPSREVGVIKKRIEEAILDGLIPNDYDAAKKYLFLIKDEVLGSATARKS